MIKRICFKGVFGGLLLATSLAYSSGALKAFPELDARAFSFGSGILGLRSQDFGADGAVSSRAHEVIPMAHAALSLPLTHFDNHLLTFSLDADYAESTYETSGLHAALRDRIHDYDARLAYLFGGNDAWAMESMISLGYQRLHHRLGASLHEDFRGIFHEHYAWFFGGVMHYAPTKTIHLATRVLYGTTFAAQASQESASGVQMPALSMGRRPALSLMEDLRWQVSHDWSLHAFVRYDQIRYGASKSIYRHLRYRGDDLILDLNYLAKKMRETRYGLAMTYNFDA
jgi:hypothetical protein